MEVQLGGLGFQYFPRRTSKHWFGCEKQPHDGGNQIPDLREVCQPKHILEEIKVFGLE